MKLSSAIEGGLLGAFALSLLHEILRHYNSDAPHLDEAGMQAMTKLLDSVNLPIPEDKKLFLLTLAGDLIANAAFYSAAGIGDKEQVWLRGILLGLSAGVGGVLLPKPMGLDEKTTARTTETKLLTMGLYLVGGVVASALMEHLEKRKQKQD